MGREERGGGGGEGKGRGHGRGSGGGGGGVEDRSYSNDPNNSVEDDINTKD